MTTALYPSAARGRRASIPALPEACTHNLWRGNDLLIPAGPVLSSGFAELDHELPGGGWPCQAVSEVLCPQPSLLEWRLLLPAIGPWVAQGREIVLVGPPKTPHLPGLQHGGLDERHLIWVRAETPAERLWCLEQLLKAASQTLLIAWLPQARPEQIRRLQVCAETHPAPAIMFRPDAARHEHSAAPLRILARTGADWTIQLQILKRRGAPHPDVLHLPAVSGGLERVLPAPLQQAQTRNASGVLAENPIWPATHTDQRQLA